MVIAGFAMSLLVGAAFGHLTCRCRWTGLCPAAELDEQNQGVCWVART
jgi:hypothetical protein